MKDVCVEEMMQETPGRPARSHDTHAIPEECVHQNKCEYDMDPHLSNLVKYFFLRCICCLMISKAARLFM